MASRDFKIYALGEAGLSTIAEAVSGKVKGGGGNGNGTEARIAMIEATVNHIQSDIGEIKTDIREIRGDYKKVMGVIAATFVILAGAGAVAYMNLNDKFFGIYEKLTTIIDKLS